MLGVKNWDGLDEKIKVLVCLKKHKHLALLTHFKRKTFPAVVAHQCKLVESEVVWERSDGLMFHFAEKTPKNVSSISFFKEM